MLRQLSAKLKQVGTFKPNLRTTIEAHSGIRIYSSAENVGCSVMRLAMKTSREWSSDRALMQNRSLGSKRIGSCLLCCYLWQLYRMLLVRCQMKFGWDELLSDGFRYLCVFSQWRLDCWKVLAVIKLFVIKMHRELFRNMFSL